MRSHVLSCAQRMAEMLVGGGGAYVAPRWSINVNILGYSNVIVNPTFELSVNIYYYYCSWNEGKDHHNNANEKY